jgi:hypothetical protein
LFINWGGQPSIAYAINYKFFNWVRNQAANLLFPASSLIYLDLFKVLRCHYHA